MKSEYKENKYLVLIYNLNALLFLGIPLTFLVQGKLSDMPLGVLLVFLACGVLFLIHGVNGLRFPIYRLDGEKFYSRNIFGKEECVVLDDSWEVTSTNSQVFISKGKKAVTVSKYNLNSGQYQKILGELGKIAERNSNKRMQSDHFTATPFVAADARRYISLN